jgi:hypothetical protein
MSAAAKKATGLWDTPTGLVANPAPKQKPKSGRIVQFRPKGDSEKKLSGWRLKAHENKQKLFESGRQFGSADELPVVKCAPVVPTKPTFHVTCQNTGMKIVSGRKWPCDCPAGRKPTVKFTPGEHASDREIEALDGYVP